MGVIPGPLIEGPAALRRRPGLFDAAIGPLDLPEPHGRGGGIRYIPRTCGTSRSFPINCSGGSVAGFFKALDDFQDPVDANVFGVYSSLECGRIGFTGSNFEDLAEERLSDGEQGAVERVFWTGETETDTPVEIDSLSETATDITAAAPGSIVDVVATLEDWLYRLQQYGNVGFIHAPARIAAVAGSEDLIVEDSRGVKRTPYGSIWVFGGGYPGTGADGAAPANGGSFLHITGQVAVWRASDVHTYPADQVMDRETNQQDMISEREYAVAYDCHNARISYEPLGSA